MNHDLSNTQIIRPLQDSSLAVTEVLERVYEALNEKGYNPISQIVGYIMSGDPTYITSYKGARSLIMKVERDEILEELMRNYVESKLREGQLRKTVQAICKVVLEENVGEVVLGLPLNMDGSKGERAEKATAFYELLKKKLSCPLIFFDERLSTIEARAILDENAVPRNKQKEVLDQVAAQVILEDYLRTKGKL